MNILNKLILCFIGVIGLSNTYANLKAQESPEKTDRNIEAEITQQESEKSTKSKQSTVVEKVISEAKKVKSKIEEYENHLKKANEKKGDNLLKASNESKTANALLSEAFNSIAIQTFDVNEETLTGQFNLNLGKILTNPLNGAGFDLSITNQPNLPYSVFDKTKIGVFPSSDYSLVAGENFILNIPNIVVVDYVIKRHENPQKYVYSQVLSTGSSFFDFTYLNSKKSTEKRNGEYRLEFNIEKTSAPVVIKNPFQKFDGKFSQFTYESEGFDGKSQSLLNNPYKNFKYIDMVGTVYLFSLHAKYIKNFTDADYTSNFFNQYYYKVDKIIYNNGAELLFNYHKVSDYELGYQNVLESIDLKTAGESSFQRVVNFNYKKPATENGFFELEEIDFIKLGKQITFGYTGKDKQRKLTAVTIEPDDFQQKYAFKYYKDKISEVHYPNGTYDAVSYGKQSMGGMSAGDKSRQLGQVEYITSLKHYDDHSKLIYTQNYAFKKIGGLDLTNYLGGGSHVVIGEVWDEMIACFDDAKLKRFDPLLACRQYYIINGSAIIDEKFDIEYYLYAYATETSRKYADDNGNFYKSTMFSQHRPIAKYSINDALKLQDENFQPFESKRAGYSVIDAYRYDDAGSSGCIYKYKNHYPDITTLEKFNKICTFAKLSKNYDKPIKITQREYFTSNGEIMPLNGQISEDKYDEEFGQLINSKKSLINTYNELALINETQFEYDIDLYNKQRYAKGDISFDLPVKEQIINYPIIEGIKNNFASSKVTNTNVLIQHSHNSVLVPVTKEINTSVKYQDGSEKKIRRQNFDYYHQGIAFGMSKTITKYLSQSEAGLSSKPDVLIENKYEMSSIGVKSAVKHTSINIDISGYSYDGIPKKMVSPAIWTDLYTGKVIKKSDDSGLQEEYKYNAFGMPLQHSVKKPDGTLLSSKEYHYFQAGTGESYTYKTVEKINGKNALLKHFNANHALLDMYEHSLDQYSGDDHYLLKASGEISYYNNGLKREALERNGFQENSIKFYYDPTLKLEQIDSYQKNGAIFNRVLKFSLPSKSAFVAITYAKSGNNSELTLQSTSIVTTDIKNRLEKTYNIIGGRNFKYFQSEDGYQRAPNANLNNQFDVVEHFKSWSDRKLLINTFAENLENFVSNTPFLSIKHLDNVNRPWREVSKIEDDDNGSRHYKDQYKLIDYQYDFRGNLSKTLMANINPVKIPNEKTDISIFNPTITQYEYDQYNNPVSVSRTRDGKTDTLNSKATYSAFGFLVKDQQGEYKYCENSQLGCKEGALKSKKSPEGLELTYTYNSFGEISSITSPEDKIIYQYSSGNYPHLESIENDETKVSYLGKNYFGLPTSMEVLIN